MRGRTGARARGSLGNESLVWPMQAGGAEVSMPVLLVLALLSQSPRLDLAAPPPASQGDDLIRVERVSLELVGGTLTGLVAGTLGALVLCSGGACSGDENLAGIGYFLLAAPLGISAGTTLAGYLLDGNGSYWASTLGVALGCAVDLGVVNASHGDLGMGVDVLMIALPMIGGAVGYELTSDDHRSAIKRLKIGPILGHGAHAELGLGISGAF